MLHHPLRPTKGLVVTLAVTAAMLAWAPAQAIDGGTATTAFKTVGPGVQFTPNWVLTAHHVGLTSGSLYTNGWGSALVDAVYAAPGAGFPEHDLSLVRLLTPILGAPVLQLSSTVFGQTALDFNNPSLNIAVTMASDNNQFPRGYAHAQLREFANVFEDDHDNDPGTPDLVYTTNWLITYDDAHYSPFVQGGDSGGGLFLGHTLDETTPLLGIASAQLSELLGPGTIAFASGFVSVASYRDWIDATMLADLSDSQMALWVTTPVPEPASWLLWLAGAGVAAGAARRRARGR